MDERRFDGLAKSLGASTARRGAIGVLAALGIGLAVGGSETGADRKSKPKRKNRNQRNRNRRPITCPEEKILCGDTCYPECCPGDRQPCYSGPAATRNVGVCREGSKLCLRNGTWSPGCSGEVTPGLETCNGRDDDCDGVVDGGFADVTCGPFRTCANGRCCGVANALCSKPADCCSGSCAGFFCAGS
jgi:hypothetical protein